MRIRSTYLATTATVLASVMLSGCVTIVTPAPPTESSDVSQATAIVPPPTTHPATVPPNPVLTTDPPVDGTTADLTLPDLPVLPLTPITVNTEGGGTGPFTIQKLADDVAAGNVDKIVKSCWTQPADEVRQVYGSAPMRGAILQALTQTPIVAQGGVIWHGQNVQVTAYWEEYKSAYPCPIITWGDTTGAQCTWIGLGTFTPAMAHWRMTRILAVRDGSPVHTGDGTDYWLVCNDECSLWNPHSMEQIYDAVPPIVNAGDAQWQRLRALNAAPLVVEHIASGYYRVRAADGSTDAVAYFTADYNDFWLPYLLGEIA